MFELTTSSYSILNRNVQTVTHISYKYRPVFENLSFTQVLRFLKDSSSVIFFVDERIKVGIEKLQLGILLFKDQEIPLFNFYVI